VYEGPRAAVAPPAGEKMRGSTTGRAAPIASPPVASTTSVEDVHFTDCFVERPSGVGKRGEMEGSREGAGGVEAKGAH
jgi:hypothetical protein